MTEIACPKCGSKNWKCYDESKAYFRDIQTGEIYQDVLGHMLCLDCGAGYGSQTHPDDELADEWEYWDQRDREEAKQNEPPHVSWQMRAVDEALAEDEAEGRP